MHRIINNKMCNVNQETVYFLFVYTLCYRIAIFFCWNKDIRRAMPFTQCEGHFLLPCVYSKRSVFVLWKRAKKHSIPAVKTLWLNVIFVIFTIFTFNKKNNHVHISLQTLQIIILKLVLKFVFLNVVTKSRGKIWLIITCDLLINDC